MAESIHFTLNGDEIEVAVEPRTSTAELVREQLALTGTHVGCESGVCGACTVLLDDEPVRACLLLAVQLDGRSLTTVEGLSEGDILHPVQQAFVDCHSFQCGFCAPGVVMTTVALLADGGAVDEERARDALDDNLCRCTGYEAIVDGILTAASRRDAADAAEGVEEP